MNSTKKLFIVLVMMMLALLFVPTFCSAASASASNEQELIDAINDANASDEATTISLSDSITITKPLPEVTKNVTIEGNGHTISGDDNWYKTGGSGNQSIITSTAGTLTLKNLILQHGPKQGAQAYGNGHLVLDGVTISDFKYSGLIANGGIIEIKDLNLNTTAGIEIGKSKTNNIDVTPTIKMNGTLKTTSKALLYEDSSTPSPLIIENEEGTTDKLFVTEEAVFITDENNNVIYEAQNVSKIDIENSEMSEEKFVTVTINYNEKNLKLVVTKNDTLSKYDLADVKRSVDGKVFANFVTKDNKEFSETTPITEDIELTAVYKEEEKAPTNEIENSTTNNIDNETKQPSSNNQAVVPTPNDPKDNTPKTGKSNYLAIGLVTLSIVIVSIVVFRRKFE